jgi:hypothetical protein
MERSAVALDGREERKSMPSDYQISNHFNHTSK